jgi:nitrilase
MQENFKVAVVQAAPEFMNLDAGVDKAIDLIKTAADNGARFVAFPECWLPGYPWWAWLSPTAMNVRYFQTYHENCLVVDSPQFQRLAAAASEHGIYLSMGASERDYGSLYISQFLFDDQGKLVKARRKLKPTHMERTIFGEGDGSDLEVSDTALGRIGQLACWEHLQPLSKYAMYSMHEQLHVAAWPSFSLYPQAYTLGSTLCNALSQVYAAEGQCFVLAPCGIVSDAMIKQMVETPEQAELLLPGGGFAQIYGPDGAPLCEPLPEQEEGLLFADIDFGAISIAKSFADPVGHYSRPDVTRLLLNREARDPVQYQVPAESEIASDEDPEGEVTPLD